MKLTVDEHLVPITEALQRGESYRSIAQGLGCNHVTVSAFAKLHLPDLRRKPIKEQAADDAAEREASMKILVIDIETRPNLAHVWGIWDQNIGLNQLLESAEMICWAAKWAGEPLLRFKSAHTHGREEMVQTAWNLLNRADVVMHYNGRRFDVPHLNREFLLAGLQPPAPYKQIDLLSVVRKQFKFPSYKLAYVSKAMGLAGKVGHEGHELWIKCMEGCEDAWARMQKYNEQDVVLVEELYAALVPWITGHPSHGAMSGNDVCPSCGSDDLQPDGHHHTNVSKFPRYRCGGCGSFSRGNKREDSTTIAGVAA